MSLEDTARRAVEAALAAGAGDAEAWAEQSTSRNIRVYDGRVESMSDAGGRGVGVRAFTGTRSGYAYGTDLSDEGVAEAARAALAAAEVADEDEFAGLPDEFGVAEVDGLASPALARTVGPASRRSSAVPLPAETTSPGIRFDTPMKPATNVVLGRS